MPTLMSRTQVRNLILHKQIFSLHKGDIFLTGIQLTDLESNKRTASIIYISNTDILALKGGTHNYDQPDFPICSNKCLHDLYGSVCTKPSTNISYCWFF